MTEEISPLEVEITAIIVPSVPREYPLSGPTQTYSLFYSQLFESAPSTQGETGDFYVSKYKIYYKSLMGKRWIACHFNKKVLHPSKPTLHLSCDKAGPCWARLPWNPLPFGQEWNTSDIARQFHLAVADYKRRLEGPGGDSEDPIIIE